MAAFRRRVAAGGMLLVIAVMIRGASAYRGPVWPTMTASATESASFTPTGTPTASPCPSCTPMLNVTIASDQCGALGVCGTKQCALEVDIEFAYLDHLKLPGGHVWGNILASQDCKTWWHTGSSRDLYLGTSGRVNVSDGCYGDGDSALVVVTCVSQYLYPAKTPGLNCINNNPALWCPELKGRCVTVKAAVSPGPKPGGGGSGRRLAAPTQLPCCDPNGVWIPSYAQEHIPACGASNTNDVAIIVSVACVGVVVVGFVSCKVYLRRKEAASRRRKEMIRCLQAEHIDIAGREFLLSDSYWTDSERSRSGSGASSRGGSFATIDTDPSIVSDRGE